MINNVNNEKLRQGRDSNKIIALIVLIVTLMVCVTSATYAYFAISAVNNTTMTGAAATVNLNLVVTRVTPDATAWAASTQKMVPQLTSALGSAMNTTNKCVDGNSNVVCEVFQIVVTNTGTAQLKLRGTIHFTYTGTNATFNNLYWRVVSGVNTLGTTGTQFKASTVETTESSTAKAANSRLVNNLVLNSSSASTNKSATYYVVVWIEEIDADQGVNAATNVRDVGTWTATVSFKDQANPNKGVTSTIVS